MPAKFVIGIILLLVIAVCNANITKKLRNITHHQPLENDSNIHIYRNGLNNFDKIYYINLDHRKDRLHHIQKELNKTNIEMHKIQKISGVVAKFGSLGCSKSHYLALEMFINSKENNCIIFEDDFSFTENQSAINLLINRVFNELIEFDVVMLSANIFGIAEKTQFNFVTKIIDAQTTSGYAVNKKFAPKLLNNLNESITSLENLGHSTHELVYDQYWKKLQPSSNWYCLKPKIGKQMKSYSNIEQKDVDYNA